MKFVLFVFFCFSCLFAYAGDFSLRDLGNGTAEISRYEGNSASVSVPSTVDGKRITRIGGLAFFGNETLRSVSFSENLTEISEFAFAHCSNLERVTFPKSLKKIGARAFFNCGKLSEITLPDTLTSLGDEVFALCPSLKKISAPKTLKELGKYAFPRTSSGRLELDIAFPGDGVIDAGEKSEFIVSVKNSGSGDVYGCRLTIDLGDRRKVSAISFPPEIIIPKISSGETQKVKVPLDVAQSLETDTARFVFSVRDDFKRAFDTQPVDIGTQGARLEARRIEASLSKLIDTPPTNPVDTSVERFVLIVANQDYENAGVAQFVSRDGKIFKEYCELTLGIPARNIVFKQNLRTKKFRNSLNDIIKKVKGKQNAELIFYYSGHGYPKGDQSYLLSCDADPSDERFEEDEEELALPKIYDLLGKSGARLVTVFLDACFTGATRSGNAIVGSERGVYDEEPETDVAAFPSNLIVFSAASGSQTAHSSDKLQHGIFTTALLKKLRDTKGRISFRELRDSLPQDVSDLSSDSGKPEQSPQVFHSEDFRFLDTPLYRGK